MLSAVSCNIKIYYVFLPSLASTVQHRDVINFDIALETSTESIAKGALSVIVVNVRVRTWHSSNSSVVC